MRQRLISAPRPLLFLSPCQHSPAVADVEQSGGTEVVYSLSKVLFCLLLRSKVLDLLLFHVLNHFNDPASLDFDGGWTVGVGGRPMGSVEEEEVGEALSSEAQVAVTAVAPLFGQREAILSRNVDLLESTSVRVKASGL